MKFNPNSCRNESDVRTKLIVNYLLPKLGYPRHSWYEEVVYRNLRLDFFIQNTPLIPNQTSLNLASSLIIETKHPNRNLDDYLSQLRTYLHQVKVFYGILTNGKDFRIYRRFPLPQFARGWLPNLPQLIFECRGEEIERKIDKIIAIVGKDNLKEKVFQTYHQPVILKSTVKIKSQMKVIAVYHNKGGVGKTTTVINLAAALTKKGKRVLVVDLDSQANTTFATGLIQFEDEQFDDLKDNNIFHVLNYEETYQIDSIARKSKFTHPTVDVIPSHISLMKKENDLNNLDYSKFNLLQKLEEVKDSYDIVLIDTPPSLNLYARIALITADYLIIPSDLKAFANQGLNNVKEFIQANNATRKIIKKKPLTILGVLATKISTNAKFIQHTLRNRRNTITERYELPLMETVIYERDDLAKCSENTIAMGELEIADPRSVLDYKPNSKSAQEFELLAMEVLQKIEP